MSEEPALLQQTADFWDANTREHFVDGVNLNRAEWQAHPLVQARQRRLLGDCGVGDWLRARLPSRIERALGVGVGTD